MKLSVLLKESNPIQKVLNKLKGQSSWDYFSHSYQHLVTVRRMLERSLIQSKKERSNRVKELEQMERDRTQLPDGSTVNPLVIDGVKRDYWFYDKRIIGFLKRVQQLETEWFSLLSLRGLDLLTDEDIESVEVYFPKNSNEQ